MLTGSYRSDQFADPETFAIQCGVLFEKHDIEVVEYITDIRNAGCLQLKYKWPPSLEEIGAALTEEAERRHRMRQDAFSARPQKNRPYMPPDWSPGCWAKIYVDPQAPQFHAVLAFTQMPDTDPRDWRMDGRAVWISYHAWQTLYSRMTAGSSWTSMSDAALRAYYGKHEAEVAAEKRMEEYNES